MQNRFSDTFSYTIKSTYNDDAHRREVLFILLNVVLGFISAVMTVVNIITGEKILTVATAVFAFLCFLNCILTWHHPKTKFKFIYEVFFIEVLFVLTFFLVSGIPNGFSVLWILVVPAFAMPVLGPGIGAGFSVLVFLITTFFFWCPFGRFLLQYNYSETFMLRFPFVYICLSMIAVYVEFIRLGTYKELQKAEQKATYLYRHDALTGIYNRHAFYEELRRIFETPSQNKVAVLIMDLDDFKVINDKYGHNAGDEVLKATTRIILNNTCEHCISCRWGGEEFLVLMQCEHDAYSTAENIRKAVEKAKIHHEDSVLKITTSVGVAVADSISQKELSDFINCADKALYVSKQSGKNRTTITHFRPD